MARHILGVDVIPTNNDQILHLFDTSSYAPGLGVTCPRLEILIPGFRTPRLVEPAQHFNLALNGITLDLISPEADFLPPLPDGVYHIKYSISPNDVVYIEFNHLRVVNFQKRLFRERCQLNLNTCSPVEDVREDLKKLQEIEDYLKSAIGSVEECGDEIATGIQLFNYARKLFERHFNQC